jgi:hypothetical protein
VRWLLLVSLFLAACGGGSSAGPPPPPVPTPSLASLRLSQASPFAIGCNGTNQTGIPYRDAEVEPSVAVNPLNPANLIAAWQQDRWSDGGSQGLVTAASFDTGHSWVIAIPVVSRCAGGNAGNGASYDRASDPWLTFAADGTAYALSLSFTGATFAANSTSAMLVARSTDGGSTWRPPVTLITDGSGFLNDKGSITADQTDARYVYAVWDRLSASNAGPTYFARTRDAGATWEPARSIYDPGLDNQTLGNILVSRPDGTLLVVFTELDAVSNGTTTGTLKLIRSPDRGTTWSVPTSIATELAVGTRDPTTGAAVRDGSDLPSVAIDHSGTIFVVWQDSRFSSGQRDAIAVSRSLDGGVTWSMPARVNGDSAAAAFVPNVHVRDDGLIGVGYYDFRSNAAQSTQLLTDYWLATSLDALAWTDWHVKGPFSLLTAPVANGLFLGDYQSLTSSGSEFLPVFVVAGSDLSNRTDVFVAFGSSAPASAGFDTRRAGAAGLTSGLAESATSHADWSRRLEENIRRVRQQRLRQR